MSAMSSAYACGEEPRLLEVTELSIGSTMDRVERSSELARIDEGLLKDHCKDVTRCRNTAQVPT
jgi:hypothetical protein